LDEFILLRNNAKVGVVRGNTSSAVVLNAKIVSVHLHSEETHFTPVSAPGVATDPVLFAFEGNTVTDHSDLVVNLDGRGQDLGVDSTSVDVELVGGLDTAGNGSKLSKVRLHLVGSLNVIVFADIILLVGNGGTSAGTAISGHWGNAISAQVEVGASGLQVVGDVLLARTVRDTRVVGILVDTGRVTTVTAATSLAVDDSLGIQAYGGGILQVVKDVKSVGDGASSALGPA